MAQQQTTARAGPTVEHVAGTPAIQLGTYDHAKLGYTIDEYFISGTAQAYTLSAAAGENGPWTVAKAATAPYATRIVVVRPVNRSKFSGTVITEWFNVSGGQDLSAAWNMAHRDFMRNGDIFVGVSAQKVGVEGGGGMMGAGLPALKQQNPQRYARLNHPGDAYSFDIFSQVGRALKDRRISPLGTYVPKRVLATGESQSAAYLTTYVNTVDPVARVYDGFLIHSRSASGSSLTGARGGTSAMPPVVKIRTDVRVPVLVLQAETDVPNFLKARQPDNSRLRTWEMAGTAHADRYAIAVANVDSGLLPIEQLVAAYAETAIPGMKSGTRINDGPQMHYIAQAAFRALDRWVATGKAPPSAPVLNFVDGKIQYGTNGMATGGIRSPWVDVPTAKLLGAAAGSGFMVLMGSSEHYDRAKLDKLYPGGRAEYLAKFTASLDSAIAKGFILRADRKEILDLAAASYGR
jgi:hypothetical protein